MNGHLRGAMEGQIGNYPPGQSRQAPILDNGRIHPGPAGLSQEGGGLGQLPVREKGIHCQIGFDPPKAAVGRRRRQLLLGKIFRAPAGVADADAEIYRVSAGLDGGNHGLPVAGR